MDSSSNSNTHTPADLSMGRRNSSFGLPGDASLMTGAGCSSSSLDSDRVRPAGTVPPPFLPVGGGRAITGGRLPPPPLGHPPPMPSVSRCETPDCAPPNFLRVNLRVPPPNHPPAVPLTLPPPPLYPPRSLVPHLPPPPPPMGFPYLPGGGPMVPPPAAVLQFPPPPLPRVHHSSPRFASLVPVPCVTATNDRGFFSTGTDTVPFLLSELGP
jgi:hypothetical protein